MLLLPRDEAERDAQFGELGPILCTSEEEHALTRAEDRLTVELRVG